MAWLGYNKLTEGTYSLAKVIHQLKLRTYYA